MPFLKSYLDFHSINSASPKVSKPPDGLFFEMVKIFLLEEGCNFFQNASVRHLGSYIGAHRITMPVLKNHPALLWKAVLIGCLPSVAVFSAHTFACAGMRCQKWKKMNYLNHHVKNSIQFSCHYTDFYISLFSLPFILVHFMKLLSVDSTVKCQPDLRSFLRFKDGSSFWYSDL